MQSKQMKLIVAAVSALVALSCGAVQAAPIYTVTDLGTLGGSRSFATDINSSGQVVGYIASGNSFHAFLYSGGSMTNLGHLGSLPSYAGGINNSGQVVGTRGPPTMPFVLFSTPAVP